MYLAVATYMYICVYTHIQLCSFIAVNALFYKIEKDNIKYVYLMPVCVRQFSMCKITELV